MYMYINSTNNVCQFSLASLTGGDDLSEAFEQCVMSMYGYMTEIEYVEMKEEQEIVAEGERLLSNKTRNNVYYL